MSSSHSSVVGLAIGFFVGGVSKTIIAPIERAKLLTQCQNISFQFIKNPPKKYDGVIDTLIRIPKEQGFSALWYLWFNF